MGYYKCIRCGGRDTYESEETTSYTAMTIDNPGPVDHTLINANKREVMRCRACGEKAEYIMSSAEAERQKELDKKWIRFGLIAFPVAIVGVVIFFIIFFRIDLGMFFN